MSNEIEKLGKDIIELPKRLLEAGASSVGMFVNDVQGGIGNVLNTGAELVDKGVSETFNVAKDLLERPLDNASTTTKKLIP